MTNQTNVKNCKPISREDRKAAYRHYQLGGFLEYDKLPDWYQCEVNPQSLRIVHDDFRGEPLIKGELISAHLISVRGRIDSGDFPFANDIRSKWQNKPPIYVLRTKHNGELYVYDGQKRTFNACYNAEEWMQAFMVDVDEDRAVL